VSPLGGLSLNVLNVSEQRVDIGQVLVRVDNPVVGLDGEPVPLDDPSYNEADNTFYPAPGTDSVSWDDGEVFDGELLFFAYHEDLVVTMGEADATFERLYEWKIDKSARNDGNVEVRNEATLAYDVTVTQTAH